MIYLKEIANCLKFYKIATIWNIIAMLILATKKEFWESLRYKIFYVESCHLIQFLFLIKLVRSTNYFKMSISVQRLKKVATDRTDPTALFIAILKKKFCFENNFSHWLSKHSAYFFLYDIESCHLLFILFVS